MKVTIVIGYYNRKRQLLHTLKTINNSLHKNIEIIIIDDCSDNPEDILSNSDFETFNMDIKLISITKEEKTWVNPCVGYNKGINKATGDIIILQNAEVCHIGDCISYVINNLRPNDWLTFNCYGLNNFEDNEYIYSHNDNKIIYEYINSLWKDHNNYTIIPGGNAAFTNKVGGWINHFLYHFTAYHYFGAMFKNDLINKMNGGFDLDYANGICFDDNDFIKRLIYNKIQFTTNTFSKSEPFVIHLYHEKAKSLIENRDEKWNINKKFYDKKCLEMNITNDWRLYNFMPYPYLYDKKNANYSNMNILIGIILHENLELYKLHENLTEIIHKDAIHIDINKIKIDIVFCIFDENNQNIKDYINFVENKNIVNESSRKIHMINYTTNDETNICNIKKYKSELTLKLFMNKGNTIEVYPNNYL